MRVSRRTCTLLGVTLLLAATGAAAEMYRCQGPDGGVLYTSDRSQCPGAEAHTPQGRIHAVDSKSPGRSAPPATRRPVPSAPDHQAMEAVWRRKKQDAEQRLAGIERDLPAMHKVVGWCNRGGELYTEDESGIRRGYSCNRAKAEYASARAEKERLGVYLREGLEEECRRAGCLPGWIR